MHHKPNEWQLLRNLDPEGRTTGCGRELPVAVGEKLTLADLRFLKVNRGYLQAAARQTMARSRRDPHWDESSP